MKTRAVFLALCTTSLLAASCGSSEPPPPREEDKALRRAMQEPIDKAKAAREASEAAAKRTEDALKQEE
jgi:hypothetical protein